MAPLHLIGTVNLLPTKGAHCDAYIDQSFFDSLGGPRPEKPTKFLIKRNGECQYSEYKLQKMQQSKPSKRPRKEF